MEKREITILDLVKIALNWIWVLLLGAVLCAGVAFFYSTKLVEEKFAETTKFVIQTKDQGETGDILDDQRTVAYAQLVVGTYIDILDTRDFKNTVAEYLNEDMVMERSYSAEGKKHIINAYIRQAMYEDGGLIEGGKLDEAIDYLVDAGFLDESDRYRPVKDVAKDCIENADKYTDSQFSEEVIDGIENKKILPDYVYLEDDLYTGHTVSEWEEIKKIREDLKGNNADYSISFSSAEESTTFTVSVVSTDANKACKIAKLCEIIIPDYIEARYPGKGLAATIDSADDSAVRTNDNTALLTIVGFVAGFVLAFVIVYIIELADNRVKNQEELAEKTGLSVMAIIPDTTTEKNNKDAYVYGKRYK